MLGKLIKYDFKSTARVFLSMFVGLFALSALMALVIPADDALGEFYRGLTESSPVMDTIYQIIIGLFMAGYGFGIAAVFIAGAIYLIVRFYRMFGSEGYLWFTLPVTPTQHLISKILVAFVWTCASFIVLLLSVVIVTLRLGFFEFWNYMWQVVSALSALGFNPLLWLILAIVFLVISVIYSLLCVYTAIAIGPNITKSRLGGTVIAYIIINVVMQIIGVVQIVVMTFSVDSILRDSGIGMMFDGSLTAMESGSDESMMAFIRVLGDYSAAIDMSMLVSSLITTAVYIVVSIVLFIVARHFMTKKLNLN